uniref:Uncharacterized protein n=1 Tax=viral metagenome TaxID=1070528 RepID=A0A6M3KZK7_9ZZZZ
MKKIISIFVFLVTLFFAINADALYLYVKTTGSGGSRTATEPASFGWADGDCYGTIAAAESAASGGDWIYIDDGEYAENVVINGIDGSEGAYTVIRARNDWGVTLNISSGFGFEVQDNYVIIRGIKTGGGVYANGSNHVKVLRCSATYSGATWTFLAGNGASYVLFEECFAYGGPHRYMFGAGGATQYVVVRRCVGRWDFSTFGVGYPLATFANYSNGVDGYVYFQNDIAIDSINNVSYTGTFRGIKAFKTPNGAEYTGMDGCIVLNFDGPGIYLESGSTFFTVNNSVVWGLTQTDAAATYAEAWGLRTYGSDTNLTMTNLTIGDNQTGNSGIRVTQDTAGETLTNSILYSISGTAVESGIDTQDSNLFYGNGSNGTEGTNAITDTDPTISILLYLPRIESGTDGATIVKRIGRTASDAGEVGGDIDGLSGTLYGETGWDELQDGAGDSADVDLWPFPNEDVIKTDMAAFSMGAGDAYDGSPAIIGARGFAAVGETLTNYIWNYLGNGNPYARSVALTGTITASRTETEIAATGGYTAILTLTGDTWVVAAGSVFDNARQAIIDGFDSAQSEATGWNAEVRDKAAVGSVVRTSDTVVTVTFAVQAGYDITSSETITVIVPASALAVGTDPVVASPTFTIAWIPAVAEVATGSMGGGFSGGGAN